MLEAEGNDQFVSQRIGHGPSLREVNETLVPLRLNDPRSLDPFQVPDPNVDVEGDVVEGVDNLQIIGSIRLMGIERSILLNRYGFETGNAMSQAEVAAKLGITKAIVGYSERRALKRVRAGLKTLEEDASQRREAYERSIETRIKRIQNSLILPQRLRLVSGTRYV